MPAWLEELLIKALKDLIPRVLVAEKAAEYVKLGFTKLKELAAQSGTVLDDAAVAEAEALVYEAAKKLAVSVKA